VLLVGLLDLRQEERRWSVRSSDIANAASQTSLADALHTGTPA
jgi:hypothetical protein